MNTAVIGFLVAIQFLITMLFFPLKIGAYGHVSLAHDKLELNVTILGLTVARLRLKQNEGIYRLLLNGKPIKSEKKLSLSQIKSIAEQYKVEGLKVGGNMLALVATQDAKNTAMLCALICGVVQPILKNFKVYTARPSDTLEIDGRVRIRINILQIVSLVSAGMKGDNNG